MSHQQPIDFVFFYQVQIHFQTTLNLKQFSKSSPRSRVCSRIDNGYSFAFESRQQNRMGFNKLLGDVVDCQK